jgi:hypothetical protein
VNKSVWILVSSARTQEKKLYIYIYFLFYFILFPTEQTLVMSIWTHECIRADVGLVCADAGKEINNFIFSIYANSSCVHVDLGKIIIKLIVK